MVGTTSTKKTHFESDMVTFWFSHFEVVVTFWLFKCPSQWDSLENQNVTGLLAYSASFHRDGARFL